MGDGQLPETSPAPPAREGPSRGRDPAVSVAGTEHQSIVEKMDWRQMKGLYDLVIKQKDEASRGSDMVIDASRFGGSDNVSDLSDNTSRETFDDQHRLGRRAVAAPAPAAGPRGGTRATQTQPQAHAAPQGQQGQGQQTQAKGGGALGEAETECISSIVSISDSLSVTALEGLVSYLNQVLSVKTRGESETREVSHMDHANSFTSDDFPREGRDRRSNSSALGTHSPDSRRQTPHQLDVSLSSPYMLSQSAPSSFFAGASPFGAALSGNLSAKRASPYRNRDAGNPAKTGSSSSSARDDNEDEDEEIKSLSSNTNDERRAGGAQRRPGSSPKPRRSFTSTPTRTPPNGLRSGAVPPVPYGSVDSDGGGIMTMASASSLSMAQRATPSDRSKKRNSESPIVISNCPVVSSAVNPVFCTRKQSSDGSGAGAGDSLKISLPGDQATVAVHSKKPRYHTPGSVTGGAPERGGSRAHPEFHMSPNCAFEDCSVNSGSISSASYYSSSQPTGGYQ
jgi:hypothetical protein